jgi:uncharacterized protein YbaA (DUF1428 family)
MTRALSQAVTAAQDKSVTMDWTELQKVDSADNSAHKLIGK